MLTDPSDSLDASPKRSIFETGRFAGGADSLECGGDTDLSLGESTIIEAGVDPEEGGALSDDPRRRNEERDPDKAVSLSSSEDSNGSVSERDGSLAGSFWVRLFHALEADRVLLAMP